MPDKRRKISCRINQIPGKTRTTFKSACATNDEVRQYPPKQHHHKQSVTEFRPFATVQSQTSECDQFTVEIYGRPVGCGVLRVCDAR